MPKESRSGILRSWRIGAAVGVVFSVLMVLASGFMIETTNTDTFCVSCHIMNPFRTSWTSSVHGGHNPEGFAAQCVDCHLPHGNFVEYLTVKAITGTSDVIHNITIDGAAHDWEGSAERNRKKFTFDSACRSCHEDLTPPGIPHGGLIAHRAYLRGATSRMCVDCHPHVGHDEMIDHVEEYFAREASSPISIADAGAPGETKVQ